MQRMRRAAAMAAAGLVLAVGITQANNLVVTNATVQGMTASTAMVKFDIAWENSWRYTNINHDAAWVFCKVQKEGEVSNNWMHVMLEGSGKNPPGYSIGTGTDIELIVPPDRMGLFVRRSGEGAGPVSVHNVRATWNFASNGLTSAARVRIQILAIEMVYIPAGPFYLGSGGGEPGHFYAPDGTAQTTTPYLVTSETNAITVANSSGNLYYTTPGVGNIGDGVGIISNVFPKGFAAFYCMKHEITQGQYRDFLNTLNREQQNKHTSSQVAGNLAMSGGTNIIWFNGIRCPGNIPGAPTSIVFGCDGNTNMVFDETNDGLDRACNFLAWADVAALADWAGLRPMSELEFEKACRGPLPPVADEYAWGTTLINTPTAIMNDGNTGWATATGGNCTFHGPFRAGIFATPTSTRQSAGASYWGIMEFSGNVWEQSVTAGNATGRSFTGALGNGVLSPNGNADVSGWPGPDNIGAGTRGSGWADGAPGARVSDRSHAVRAHVGRTDYLGGRAVRPAPPGVGP